MLLRQKKALPKEIEQNTANADLLQAFTVIFHLKTYKTYPKRKKEQILVTAEWNIWNTHNCTFETKL